MRQPVLEELARVIALEKLIPHHISCYLELIGDARRSISFPFKHVQGGMDLSLLSLIAQREAVSCRLVGTWLLSGGFSVMLTADWRRPCREDRGKRIVRGPHS